MYGSTYQVYGSKTCAHCGEAHENHLHIRETQRSRFRIMQLMAELRSTVGQAWTSFEDGPNRPTMLGLLIAQGVTIVTHSGLLYGPEDAAFRAAANGKGYTFVMPRDLEQPYESLAGRIIPQVEIDATRGIRAGFNYPPGACAAPRLIKKAFGLLLPNLNPGTWEMSEVFYKGKGDGNKYWVHGLSAHSCDTCENLVPLLLCDQGLAGGLGSIDF